MVLMMLHVTGSYHVNRQRWPWYGSHTPLPLATFHFRHRSNSLASRSLQMYNIVKRTSRGQLSEQHLPTEQFKEESYIYKQTSSQTGSLCVFVYGKEKAGLFPEIPGNYHHHCLHHMDVLSRTGYSRTAPLCCQFCPVATRGIAVLGTTNKVNYDSWYYRFEPVEVITTLECMGWVKTHGQGRWEEHYCGMHNQEVNLEARNIFSSGSSSNSNRRTE